MVPTFKFYFLTPILRIRVFDIIHVYSITKNFTSSLYDNGYYINLRFKFISL